MTWQGHAFIKWQDQASDSHLSHSKAWAFYSLQQGLLEAIGAFPWSLVVNQINQVNWPNPYYLFLEQNLPVVFAQSTLVQRRRRLVFGGYGNWITRASDPLNIFAWCWQNSVAEYVGAKATPCCKVHFCYIPKQYRTSGRGQEKWTKCVLGLLWPLVQYCVHKESIWISLSPYNYEPGNLNPITWSSLKQLCHLGQTLSPILYCLL